MPKYLYGLIFPLVLLSAPATAAPAPAADAEAVLTTKMALRDLWVEHVFWVRSYVYAASGEDAARAAVTEQEIVANAKALAGSIEPFYGKGASEALFELLAGHWGAVKAYNAATLGESAGKQKAAVEDLTANARRIADFLSGANPFLPKDAVFSLLAAHGGHHVQQIKEVSAGDYAQEAKTWAHMRKHMHVISDAIADALAKQFPEKF